MQEFLRVILLPFSIVYGVIILIRNFLYQINILKSYQFPQVKIISVGNLNVGGTGKTPFVLALAEKFNNNTAILSRGYGRQTKGFYEVQLDHKSIDVGDEALMMKYLLKDTPVAVCEDRVEGVRSLLSIYPELQVIILDDGFQHIRLKRDLNLLLTSFSKPFFNDYILPAGRLREPRWSAKRADMIFLTKIDHEEPDLINAYLKLTKSYCPQSFAVGLDFGPLVQVVGDDAKGNKVCLLAGLAEPKSLVNYISKNYELIEFFKFRDHKSFSKHDISTVCQKMHALEVDQLICTDKDWIKIKEWSNLFKEVGISVYIQTVKHNIDLDEILKIYEGFKG